MKKATYEKRIAQLEEDLREMTAFDAAGREMARKAENELGFMVSRVESLTHAVAVLSRLYTEARAELCKHTTWTRK